MKLIGQETMMDHSKYWTEEIRREDRRRSYPRMDKQTFPFRYRFGLNRTVLFPVVIKRQRGERIGLRETNHQHSIIHWPNSLIWWTTYDEIKESTYTDQLMERSKPHLREITFIRRIEWTDDKCVNLNHFSPTFFSQYDQWECLILW